MLSPAHGWRLPVGLTSVLLVSCHAVQGTAPGAPPCPPTSLQHDAGSDSGDSDGASHEVSVDVDASEPAAAAELGPGEHWGADLKSADSCEDYRSASAPREYHDPHTTKRKFGYDGYLTRQVELTREIDGVARRHCVDVYWPAGDKNNDGKRVTVGRKIGPSWFRLIERTLARLPWRHLQTVERMVIDNRPLLHGVAPFHRGAPDDDARDGRTIWLNEHLFTGMNHWVHGTYGHYWAYHLPIDAISVDKLRADHELFSPVLLHEIGHLINYNVVNGSSWDASCPKCSEMCGDLGSCKQMKAEQREAFCATAYCTGFGHESGTENWAEMYRWYYSGRATRALLARQFPACFATLGGNGSEQGLNAGRAAPWDEGLGEVLGYRKTRWDSCKGGACKQR